MTSLRVPPPSLRKRDLPRVAADLGRLALDQHAALRSSSVAVVAVATAFEDCGERREAEQVITPLLVQGPDGLTVDRFLLTAGLRVVTDESLAERIRARLEAG